MKYHPTIKRKEIVLFAATWMNFETVISMKLNQKEKNKYHILMYMYGI